MYVHCGCDGKTILEQIPIGTLNPQYMGQFDTTYIIFRNVENITPKLIKFNIKKLKGKLKNMMEHFGNM